MCVCACACALLKLLAISECLSSLHCIDKLCSGCRFNNELRSISPTLEPGVPYNVSVRAMNGAPQSGVVTVIIAYVAPRRKFSFYLLTCVSIMKE